MFICLLICMVIDAMIIELRYFTSILSYETIKKKKTWGRGREASVCWSLANPSQRLKFLAYENIDSMPLTKPWATVPWCAQWMLFDSYKMKIDSSTVHIIQKIFCLKSSLLRTEWSIISLTNDLSSKCLLHRSVSRSSMHLTSM